MRARSESSLNTERFVVAMTGASGAAYGIRLLEVLLSAGYQVHLTLSSAAIKVFQEELKAPVTMDLFQADPLGSLKQLIQKIHADYSQPDRPMLSLDHANLIYHSSHDYNAGIASGSFLTSGMVVCPCSMGTLASLANGISTNLIHRAADVHLKERRKLVVVPRETPLGTIPLQNMKTLTDAGAVILPAMPGFYHHPTCMLDLIDFIVGRICDQLGVPVELVRRWGRGQ